MSWRLQAPTGCAADIIRRFLDVSIAVTELGPDLCSVRMGNV